MTPPTLDEWRAAGVESVAVTAKTPTFFDQGEALRAAESAARSEGEIGRARALGLSADVMSMMLKTEEGETVLFPFFIGGGRSSARAELFSDDQLDLLSQVVDEMHDAEMRARFADLLWTRRPNKRWASMAARSYLDSLQRLEATTPIFFNDRLNRALKIARTIKRDPQPLVDLTNFATSIVDRPSMEENRWLQSKVAEMMLRHRVGDKEHIYGRLLSEGARLRDMGDLLGPSDYFRVAGLYAKAIGDVDAEVNAIREEAESVLREAEKFENGDPTGALIAASRYEDAIAIYRRRARSFDTEIEAIKRRIVHLQNLGQEAMAKIEVETTVSNEVLEFVEGTHGLSLPEALHRIALQARPGDIVSMRQVVLDRFRQSPLLYLLGGRIIKESGLTDAKLTRLPLDEQGAEAEWNFEQRIRQEMLRERTLSRDMAASLLIDPMRRIVVEENDVQRVDFSALFTGNPFVPEDRRELFQKGFVYGLLGDYMVAAHLLVPQIENSIRHVMRARGLVTSKFSKDGIQDELNLVELLMKDEHRGDVVSIFGEELTFELEGLFVSRFGSNLRNHLAHGMMSDGASVGSQACFAWAIVVLMLLLGLDRQTFPGEEGEDTATDDGLIDS